MKRTIGILVLLCAWTASSQPTRIEFDEPRLISADVPYPLTEPHLIVDPRDPNHLLVAAITVLEPATRGSRRPRSHITLFQSYDGGNSWESRAFDTGIEMGADPWLAMNDRGVIVLTALNGLQGDDPGIFLLASVSSDGGKTWQPPMNLGRGHDRESIVVDPRTQDFLIVSAKRDTNANGNVRWGISTIRLDRGGVFRRSSYYVPSNVDQNNTQPVFTADGQLVVPFIDYLIGEELLKTRRAWIVRSEDAGATYSEPVMVTEQEWGAPLLAIDQSRSHPGRLYYLKILGGRRAYGGLEILHSDDLGETWSKGVAVSDNPSDHPFMGNPAMAVNADGILGISWYDRRNDPLGEEQDLYFAVSIDGGESFLEAIRVTPASGDPSTEANGWAGERWSAGGDYHGLAPLPDGSFQIVWSHSPEGLYRLYTSRVRAVTE